MSESELLLDRLGAKAPEDEPLRRAHSVVVSAGADSAVELAWELRRLADRLERGELTKGCVGGPSSGSIYSYAHDPEMTHDRYFLEIDRRLERGGGA